MRSMFIDEIYIDKADSWVPLKTPPELRSSSKASPTWEISKFSHCNTLSWVKPDSTNFHFLIIGILIEMSNILMVCLIQKA